MPRAYAASARRPTGSQQIHPWSDVAAPRAVYGGGVARRTRANRQPWRLGPRGERWFDVGLTVTLLLPVLPYALVVDARDGVLMVAQIVPLLVRRRHPVAVFAAVAVGCGVQALLADYPLWSQAAFPIAIYSIARYAAPLWSRAALVVGLAGAGIATFRWLNGFGAELLSVENVVAYYTTIALFVVVAWTLGTLGRTRQAYVDALVERGERLEREAAQQAALAAIEERHRIAREMHDVVAHGLTTIVVQADGARAAAAHDPTVTGPALGTIADTGREAIAELRRMLGLLRAEDAPTAPQPRLADVLPLVEEARAAGTPVVAVTEDGRGAAAVDDGRGLGLTGMRERVAAHDGTLSAGPAPGGGFAVCARIPL